MAARLLPTDDAKIENVLLDRPIVSITDLAYTYGRLDGLYVRERVREASVDVPGPTPEWVKPTIDDEHLLAMTPGAHPDHFDQDDSLIAINLVLSPDEPTRLHDTLVTVSSIDWIGMICHGFVKRPTKRGKVYDHSLAININGKKPEQITHYVESRFVKWSEGRTEAIDDRDDAWIIDEIETIGKEYKTIDTKEGETHSIVTPAINAVKGAIEGLENKSWSGILSVNLWFDTGAEDPVGPFPPGLLPVVNEVTVGNYSDQIETFSVGSVNTAEGVDPVTGEEATLYPLTPGRPLEYFHPKQQRLFEGFDRQRGSQGHPLSLRTAMAVAVGSPLMAGCREWVGGRSRTVHDVKVHYLPFVPIMSADDARDVYRMIHRAVREDKPISTQLAEAIGTWLAPENLRFHLVVINTGVEQMKNKVLEENLGASLMPIADLARAHAAVLTSWVLSADPDEHGWAHPRAIDIDQLHPEWLPWTPGKEEDTHTLFDRERSQVVPILTGRYLGETMFDPDRHSKNPTTSANDPRIRALAAIAGGEPVSMSELAESFAVRLVRDQRDLMGQSGQKHIPYETIVAQYIQTNALARAGLLDTEGVSKSGVSSIPYPIMVDTSSDNDSTVAPNDRDAKLDQFLESHGEIDGSEGSSAALRAAFLLGGFVGRISAYQLTKGISSPVSRRWPIDSVNRSSVRAIFADAAAKNEEYSFAHNSGYPINERYIERLDSLLDEDPRKWRITEDSLQTAYALGLTYARSDKYDDDPDLEPADEDKIEQGEEQAPPTLED